TKPQESHSTESVNATITALQSQLQRQQAQIDELSALLKAQQELLIARTKADVDTSTADAQRNKPDEASSASDAATVPVTEEEFQQFTTKVDQLGKQVETTTSGLGGFKFSGDFRFRLDSQLRGGNNVAGPLQNVRSRYRLRLNVDKELDSRFKVHAQLST